MTVIDETLGNYVREIVRGDVPGGPSTTVGVVLYELLCKGEHPYLGSKPMLGEQVIDPRTIRPDLPPELAEFLVKACAPYRNERFSTAREMKDALSAIRSGGR